MIRIMLKREKNISPKYPISRQKLREMAKKYGVKRGRNTEDTVRNLKAAGFDPFKQNTPTVYTVHFDSPTTCATCILNPNKQTIDLFKIYETKPPMMGHSSNSKWFYHRDIGMKEEIQQLLNLFCS